MRDETTNTWEDGLVMDLNPISTPNNVLTDNLNGTLITYNGNEFILQNDQGNYPLKDCRLKPNYLPVGTKEYNGILYIVSYNPINEKVEVGSYPSPLWVNRATNPETSLDVHSVIKTELIDKNQLEGNWTELSKKNQNIIFSGEDLKLNPGDKYCITTEDDEYTYRYETVDFYVTDSENNLRKIQDPNVKKGHDILNENFKYINWQTPGWVTMQTRLAEIETANINIRSFYVPNMAGEGQKNAYFAFNLRLNISDPLILNNSFKAPENHYEKDIRFRLELYKNNDIKLKFNGKDFIEFYMSEINKNPLIFNLNDTQKLSLNLQNYDTDEWFDDNIIVWKNIAGSISNINLEDKYSIAITPIIGECKTTIDPLYKLIYDNHRQQLTFDLKDSDTTKWNIGTSLFKYEVENEYFNLMYNIEGPMISTMPITVYYKLYDFSNNPITDYIEDKNASIGENSLIIKFTDIFKRNEIYYIEFVISPSKDDITEFGIKFKRCIVTSTVFNNYTEKIFDKEISFNRWINDHIGQAITDSITLQNPNLTNKSKLINDIAKSDAYWDLYKSRKHYKTFVPSKYNLDKNTILSGYNYDIVFDVQKKNIDKSGILQNCNIKYTSQAKDNYNNNINVITSDKTFTFKNVTSGLKWDINYLKGDPVLLGNYETKFTINDAVRTENNRSYPMFKWTYDWGNDGKYTLLISEQDYNPEIIPETRLVPVYAGEKKDEISNSNLAQIHWRTNDWLVRNHKGIMLSWIWRGSRNNHKRDLIIRVGKTVTQADNAIHDVGSVILCFAGINGVPTILPLGNVIKKSSTDVTAYEYYNHEETDLLYNHHIIYGGNETFQQCIQYDIGYESKLDADMILNYFVKSSVDNLIYYNSNLLNYNDRKNKISNLNLEYNNIILGENDTTNSFISPEKQLIVNNAYSDDDPCVIAHNEWRSKLDRITNYEVPSERDDYASESKWLHLPTRYGRTSGIYYSGQNISAIEKYLPEISENIQKYGKVCLDGKSHVTLQIGRDSNDRRTSTDKLYNVKDYEN